MGIFRFLNQWREKDDGTLSGPALEADTAIIGGETSDFHWEQIDKIDTQTDFAQLNTNLRFERDTAIVSYRIQSNSTVAVKLQTDGDGNTGDYDYLKYDGTTVSGADGWSLASSNTFVNVSGMLHIARGERQRISTISAHSNWNQEKPQLENGFRDKNDSIDTLDFDLTAKADLQAIVYKGGRL